MCLGLSMESSKFSDRELVRLVYSVVLECNANTCKLANFTFYSKLVTTIMTGLDGRIWILRFNPVIATFSNFMCILLQLVRLIS